MSQKSGEVGFAMEVLAGVVETAAVAALAVVGRTHLVLEELVIVGQHKDSVAVVQLSKSYLAAEGQWVGGPAERKAVSQVPARTYWVVEHS